LRHELVPDFFGAQGWPSSDTSVIRYITSPTISCVRPLLEFFIVDLEAYRCHHIRYLFMWEMGLSN
jgi:hypothetical protein